LKIKELAMDLKALDPTGEVDLCILLITNRCKGKSTIICPDIRLEASAKWIVARKEVSKIWRRLADLGKDNVALLTAGLKETVCKREVEGSTYGTATRKRTNSMWRSWSKA
jgi:hypothetical protein